MLVPEDKIQKVTFVILSYLNVTKCQNIQIFITHKALV